jgi:arginase
VDFAARLSEELSDRFAEDDVPITLVHLDVDALDDSLGKGNHLACPGGLLEDDLARCVGAIADHTTPLAFTVASFDPLWDGDGTARRVAGVVIRAITTVLERLEGKAILVPSLK